MTETIWFHDVLGFFKDTSHFSEFIPDRSMTLTAQLNAVFRFALYLTIILLVIKQDLRSIYIVVFVGFITWIIYVQDTSTNKLKNQVLETLNIGTDVKNRACYKPTSDNPFMNVSLGDYKEFPNRPKACDVLKHDKEVTDLFETTGGSFVRATDDIYNRGGGDRQFYTNPSTTIPNDQEGFARFLFPLGKTLKEDGLTNFFTPGVPPLGHA